MAKYVFTLAPVLQQRLAEERRAQLELANAERERLALEGQLRAYQREIDREREEWREHLGGAGRPVDVRCVRLQAYASLQAATRAQQVVLKLVGAARRVDKAREALLEATKRRRALEELRDRQLEAFLAEQKRKEAHLLDDLNVMRAHAARGQENAA